MEQELFKVYEEEYLENPDQYEVHFIGWDIDGKVYAVCNKV